MESLLASLQWVLNQCFKEESKGACLWGVGEWEAYSLKEPTLSL